MMIGNYLKYIFIIIVKNIRNGQTTHNRTVYATPPNRRLGLRKTAVGLRPLCSFVSARFWQPANAKGGVRTDYPLLRLLVRLPKPRKQPERYVPFCLKILDKNQK
jgi:hypothetical protein